MRFFGFVVSAQGISMEEERFETVNVWPESKSKRDIQVFLRFANFYRRFIQGYSKIAAPRTLMLKSTPIARGGAPPKADDDSTFLTPKAKLAFLWLRQAFTKAAILHHFNPDRNIRIETNASGYAIGAILSQLAPETSQWYSVALFLRKMIPAETKYKTHDQELLAIVKALKTWHHYLESCRYEVFVLTDHNNLRRFMDIKSLSSRQVRLAQKLSWYYFWIEYQQGKANAAADALSQFPQRSQSKEEELWVENTQFFIGYSPHWLTLA